MPGYLFMDVVTQGKEWVDLWGIFQQFVPCVTDSVDEDQNYLFLKYQYASPVWNLFPGIPTNVTSNNLSDMLWLVGQSALFW